MNRLLVAFFAMIYAASCHGGSNPVEVGTVRWSRDLEAVLLSSGQSGRPVFALFQEVPGCAGCQQFGKDVLSNPLLVEAIESEFTPLLIHNNQPGKDAGVLERFGEPAWNYQVVRFLNSAAKDIIPRQDQVWDTGGIAERMVMTLEEVNRPVPPYLRLLAAEHSPHLRQAAFSMFCFWTGEMALGQMEGVVSTQAGFNGGREVVLLSYDPAILSLEKLISAAGQSDCRHMESVPDYRPAPASDQKKQIEGTPIAGLPLSAAQTTKVNAWLRVDPERALSYLSPSQRARVKGTSIFPPSP